MGAADFSGYATKAGLKCSDGRTITAEAFKHMDGMQVPLVWQHGHNDPVNVLGHGVLKARNDGMYIYGYFNDTPAGQQAKALVMHKDIKNLSIYANQLKEHAKRVLHGVIREVSLVLAGANPGAVIDFVNLQHSDGELEVLDDEAVIHTGLELEFEDLPVEEGNKDEVVEHAEGKTAQEVYDGLDEEERNLLLHMVAAALEAQKNSAAEHSDGETNAEENAEEKPGDNEGDLSHKEGSTAVTNVFEQNGGTATAEKHVLTHDAMRGIAADAVKCGSLKQAVEAYALQHGITNLDILFPDAKTLNNTPEWNKRRTEWVPGVINGVRKSPFSRVKSIVADITMDAARALGYIKGSFKKEEWFSVTKRTTGPTTVYKKQKLDRDDVVDIVDFDVVAWMKGEMRMMLEEELARAILIGDGRDPSDEDKIKDPVGAADGIGIRSILHDHELYVTTVNVNVGSTSDYNEVVEAVLRARRFYKGSGGPTFYSTEQTIVEMLLSKDSLGRRRWNNKAELAAALMVSDVVAVEVMEQETDLLGIIVNLSDYNVGADRGGEVNLFDDFDIDYNQLKYLIETRVSGALVKIKSALVVKKVAATTDTLAVPTEPTFNKSTGVITIPTVTGVVYKDTTAAGSTMTAGAQTALAAGATKHVVAVPASGYYFSTNAEDEWDFTRDAA